MSGNSTARIRSRRAVSVRGVDEISTKVRRAIQGDTPEMTLEFPIGRTKSGRIGVAIDPKSGLYVNSQGLALRLDDTLEAKSGSPYRIGARANKTPQALAASAGMSTAAIRRALARGTPVSVASSNATGSAATISASDHQHAHGVHTDPACHATAVEGAAGFMSGWQAVQAGVHPWAKRSLLIQADPGATFFSVLGTASALSLNGTPSNADDSNGSWIRHTSLALLNAVAGVFTGTATRFQWGFELAFYIDPATVNVRNHFGLYSADPSGAASLAALSASGFRYDTTADGTAFLRAITANAASETVTVTTTAPARGWYFMRAVGSAVRFYAGSTQIAEHTTTLPVASTSLRIGVLATSLAVASTTTTINSVALATN